MRHAFVPEDWIPVAWAMRCSWDALRLLSQVYGLRKGNDMRISLLSSGIGIALLLHCLSELLGKEVRCLCSTSWILAYVIYAFDN
jgi:hypothetical protein